MSEYILPHVDGYLKLGQDYDCSDIHLAVNSRPTWRRFGQLLPIWEEVCLSATLLRAMIFR